MTKRKKISLTLSLIISGLTVYYFYPEDKLSANIIIDKLVVYKSKRQLLAYSNGKLEKTYKISLGKQPNSVTLELYKCSYNIVATLSYFLP